MRSVVKIFGNWSILTIIINASPSCRYGPYFQVQTDAAFPAPTDVVVFHFFSINGYSSDQLHFHQF